MRDDELLRRYLLGDLPRRETRAVELRLLQEDDLSDLAEAIESEILEAYANGELSPERRARVGRFLASSPTGRLRLAVLGGLATIAGERRVPASVLPFPRPDVSRPLHRFAAIAAMLAIAVASFLLIPIHSKLPDQVAAVPPTPQPQEQEIPAPEPTPSPDKPGPDVIAELPQPTPAPSPSPASVLIQLALSVSRDEGPEILAHDVPADRAARLEIKLRERDKGYTSFRVILEDGLGEEVQRWDALQATTINGAAVLVVEVLAGQLQEGRYTARTQAVTPEGSVEDLAFPEFQVRQP